MDLVIICLLFCMQINFISVETRNKFSRATDFLIFLNLIKKKII